MTVTLVTPGAGVQVPVEEIAPAAQLSTASYVVLAGSELDARAWKSLSYTILVATQSVFWTVYGANSSDYSDEVVVQSEASVSAGASSSFSAAPPPFAYYRVKIKNNAGAGTATLHGICKR